MNLTVRGQHVEVQALQIPESSLSGGIGFGAYAGVHNNGSQIFSDTNDTPKLYFDTSIFLPPGLPSLFALNETCKYSIYFSLFIVTVHDGEIYNCNGEEVLYVPEQDPPPPKKKKKGKIDNNKT